MTYRYFCFIFYNKISFSPLSRTSRITNLVTFITRTQRSLCRCRSIMRHKINSLSLYVVAGLVLSAAVPSTPTRSGQNLNHNHIIHNNCVNMQHHNSIEPHTSTSGTRNDELLTSDGPNFITPNEDINMIMNDLHRKYQHQPLFLQAIQEMMLSIHDLFDQDPIYRRVFAIMTEPERTISFRITWMDDAGQLQINRGWRIEFNSALGPYKGGLRFHASVDEGILKFLAFEQIFKNALTGLPLGGGKGGSDFDPKGKSNSEVRRFCEAFMNELYRYIHPSTDVPAGDIGVGTREIGYLYGQYKRLTNRHGDGGVLTGKSLLIGGSPLRPEATGYGLVYMTQIALQKQFCRSLQGVRCAISGSGNVAQHAAQKLIQLGAKVVTVSDSNGVLVFENGMAMEDLDAIMECKNVRRGRLSSITDIVQGRFIPGKSPWTLLPELTFDIALPCATQNEICAEHANLMVSSGVIGVLEGANLPTNIEAQEVLRKAGLLYIPGKASNAGGVGVSGLEMSQNAQRLIWSSDVVDRKLQDMMSNIYDQMIAQQRTSASGLTKKCCTLEQGANRAGFLKVANAMKDLGWIY